jgi:hypothetical protein
MRLSDEDNRRSWRRAIPAMMPSIATRRPSSKVCVAMVFGNSRTSLSLYPASMRWAFRRQSDLKSAGPLRAQATPCDSLSPSGRG